MIQAVACSHQACQDGGADRGSGGPGARAPSQPEHPLLSRRREKKPAVKFPNCRPWKLGSTDFIFFFRWRFVEQNLAQSSVWSTLMEVECKNNNEEKSSGRPQTAYHGGG